MFFKSQGIFEYSTLEPNIKYKAALIVDPELARYYRSFVPKWKKCQLGHWAPHITVVRNELPPNMEKWGLYENQAVKFQYEQYIWHDQTYWWINCRSKVLEEIRRELGLPLYSKYNSPPDRKGCFYLTIGNVK